MDHIKRQDEFNLIAAALTDVHTSHGALFNKRSLKLTLNKVRSRMRKEGIAFLTKTLPRLGKAYDKSLSKQCNLSATKLGFKPMPGSELPRFLGEFFKVTLSLTGELLPEARAEHVSVIRQICYLFYKYELPYSDVQEQAVLQKFERTEEELASLDEQFKWLTIWTDHMTTYRRRRRKALDTYDVIREARILLSGVFQDFDFTNITPRHGPGAVATKQQLWAKYEWVNVSSRIRQCYPLDEYFYSSLSAVVDDVDNLNKIADDDLPARVILVPKDSRGPRLISCEPVDFQWIQQGISRSLVKHIENIPLTRDNVFFTDQAPNRRGALLGSSTGRYATLDLNEASDRVALSLVRLLFPSHVCTYLESARSSSTRLPNGKLLKLRKHAPMGSALCFPILALCVWSILRAAAPDKSTREGTLVYGDDVIVPTTFVENAIEQLESFGLKINRDKSCTSGSFRESCGMDAFKGVCVTPVRFRTIWSSRPSAEVYTSWISYANSMYAQKYFHVYDTIVELLHRTYGAIPAKDMHLACPSLVEVSELMRPRRVRYNAKLQKFEHYVRDVKALSVKREMKGWSMLLRFLVESGGQWDGQFTSAFDSPHRSPDLVKVEPAFSVRQYTRRRTSMLVRRWR